MMDWYIFDVRKSHGALRVPSRLIARIVCSVFRHMDYYTSPDGF